MIWNEKIECMERDELEELQLKRLQETVKRAFDKIPYYNKKYTENNVFPEDIETLKDIEKLPFITKDDLRESYPFGLFAVDRKKITEVHSSSGTTGKPVVSGYTPKDLDTWSETIARGLTMMGLGEEDIIQNTHGYGLFTGGFGVHYGSHKIGATIIPISTGQTRRQIEIMKDFGTTCLIFTPSYGIHLGEVAIEEGIDPKELGVKAIGFGAEMWTEEIRDKVEDIFGAKAYNIYGLTEIAGPGVSYECLAKNGMHISEDHVIAEIIDPVTEKQLPYGTPGELVFTTITKEGMPMIRYRTHDICTLTDEKCACGRTLARMSRITGRTDDMIVIRGVNVFPSQIESVLVGTNGVAPHYVLVVDRVNSSDTLEVKVELTEEMFSDTVSHIEELKDAFGKPPMAVLRLITVAYLKNLAATLDVKKVMATQEGLGLQFYDNKLFRNEKVFAALDRFRTTAVLSPGDPPMIIFRNKGLTADERLKMLREFLEAAVFG